MIKTQTSLYIVYGIISVLLLGALFINYRNADASASTVATPACAVTHTTVTIGNQLSTTILSASSRRAWATVEQPLNATNTVSVNLGSTAVANAGTVLAPATTTISKTSLTFGLDTDLPYVNAVSAITSTGSTTVLVTQCVY